MKNSLGILLLLCAVNFAAVGCGCGAKPPKDEVSEKDTRNLSDLSDLVKRANGDFAKLKPEEKAKFIATYGSLAMAKKMFKMMAHPPNAQYQKK